MKLLKVGLVRSAILFAVFVVSFFVATAAFDSIDRAMGFYDEGRKDSADLEKGLY